MADEAREITPFTAVAPDRETPVKDFRPVYGSPEESEGEPYGGLKAEEVKDGAGDEAPKDSTATESADSSSGKDDFPKVPVPDQGDSLANAATVAGKSRQGKGSQPSSSPDKKTG